MADQRYTIHEQLGAGGNGAVFRAYDTQLKRWVAVKRLLSATEATSDNPDSTELRREADTLASLRNANIVTIFDVLTDAEGLFMVMELLEGPDLADAIQHGPLMQEDFKQLAEQTLEALLAAHNLRILHRDIKPENIKVERLPGGRLQAKIIDFGLARSGLAARKQTEDQEGSVMGSIYYMAPEQLSREPTDVRTDLYSLGCVFYEALAGRKAFDGKSVNDVIDKHIDHDLVPLNQLCPHLPQWLTYWVMRLMACKPEDRPTNAQQAIEEFRAWEKLPPNPGMMPWMPMNYGYGQPMQGYPQQYSGTATVPLYHNTGPAPAPNTGYYGAPHITSSSVPVPPQYQPQPQSGSVPVAIPVPSALVNEAVASVLRSTGPQRPTVTAPHQHHQAKPPTSSPRRNAGAAAAPEKKSLLFVYIGAGAVVVLGLAAFFMTRGGDKPMAQSPTSKPGTGLFANGTTVGPAREDLFPQERGFPAPENMRVAHFAAKVGTHGYLNGKPAPQIDDSSPVSVWEDLSKRGDNTPLVGLDFKPETSPERVTWNTPDKALKDGRFALSFKNRSGKPVAMRLYQADQKKESFPFGSQSPPSGSGLTLAVVLQAPADHIPCRVLSLASADGKSSVTLRINSSRGFEAEFITPQGKAKLSSSQVDATKPCQAILHWNGSTTDLQLRTRDQRGATHGARAKLAPPTTPLYVLELGGTGTDKAQLFSGLLADFVLLANVQKDDQSALMDKELRDHYFNPPKPGALNPLRNLKLADFPVDEERDIFNGTDLTGWEASNKYWSVSDGMLVGRGNTTATTNTTSCFAYWKDGTVGDFELRFKTRITGGNSGVMYRGNVGSNNDTGPTIAGYQFDLDSGRKDRWGVLTEINGRGDLGKVAQKVRVQDHTDVRKATLDVQDKALGDPNKLVGGLKTNEWNEIRIVARGNMVQHYINNNLVLELLDDGHGRYQDGVIGAEIPPKSGTTIHLKDIRVKRLR